MDMVHFLGKEKTILASTGDTVQVLEWIHKDGHLWVKKTLNLFRLRFEGIREKALCQAVVSSCEGCQLEPWIINPEPHPRGKDRINVPYGTSSV